LARDYHARTGQQRTAVAVAEAAEAGDTLARDCLDLFQDRLARSLASIINVLDPGTIVLAGGLSNLTCLYPALPPLLKSYTFSADTGTPIVRAMHGDSSGVRGAAWLWQTSGINTVSR
jgi:fructokinase